MTARPSLGLLLNRMRSQAALIRRLEWALSLAILVCVAGVGAQLYLTGHLTSPLQPNPRDFGMDLFRTAYWGQRGGMYSEWHSVYPPISFLFVRLFSNPGCYRLDAYAAKSCDGGILAAYIAFYLLGVCLAGYVFWRHDRRTALPRTLALAVGLPMLYGLEWTNMVVVCFPFFVLAQSATFPPWVRTVAGGVTLNLKPYLLPLAYPVLCLRGFRSLILLAGSSVAIYIASFLILGRGGPLDLISDFLFYFHNQPDELVKYNHLAELAHNDGGLWQAIFPLALRAGQAAAVLCCLLSAASPRRFRLRRLGALLLTAISSEVALRTQAYAADYSQIFTLFLIFSGLGKSVSARVALVCAYLLCLPVDLRLLNAGAFTVDSMTTGRPVVTEYGVMLGQYVRPLILLVLQAALIRLNLTGLGRAWWADLVRLRFAKLRPFPARS